MTQVNAITSLMMTQGIAAAFNSNALADLSEVAGLPEREIVKMRMQAAQSEMSNQGSTQWQ